MRESILGFLNTFLVPFVLAVPLAVLLLIAFRRGDDDRTAPDSKPGALPDGTPAASPPTLTTFPATLPPLRPPPPVAPSAPVPSPADSPAPSLLIVDDSAVARAKLKRLFEGAGFSVSLANDGSQALETLATQRFSVLITDLEMPVMNGVELIAAVQGSLDTEDLPIIAITGHDEMHARVHDIAGLYGLFKKPWNDRDLLRRVSTLATLQRPAA